MLADPLSSVSPREEKQGLQKDAPSEERSTNGTPNQDQDEWRTIPINTFWMHSKKKPTQNGLYQQYTYAIDTLAT